MEEELDEIAEHKKAWGSVIQDFYTPFEKTLVNAKEMIEKVKMPEELTNEVCEKCGKPIAIKLGRFGKFLACTGYPECKTTKKYQIKTGVACPECGSEILQRNTKKNKIFYGCSNYPNCKFAVNTKPLPHKCPDCGSMLTEYKENQAKCTKCKYRGPVPEAKVLVAAT